MKKRVIAAVALLPLLLIVVVVLPKIFTAILFGVMAAIGAYELLVGTGYMKPSIMVVQAGLGAFLVSLWSYFGGSYPAMLIGVIVYVALLYGQILMSHTKIRFEKASLALVAGILVPFTLTALVRLHCHPHGRYLILIPFVIAFLSDTGAYFAGRAFGKHKLAPIVSPNKTIEGVAGGVLGAIVGMLIYCIILQYGFHFRVNYFYAIVYGLIGSLGAVFGDLSFSAIKRQTGIKDYGNLIPGHGGILDRFDSMTVVAPLVEALFILMPVVTRLW